MARLNTTSAAVAGGIIGLTIAAAAAGPLGVLAAFQSIMLGASIAQMFVDRKIEAAQLDPVKPNKSEYGGAIPRVYANDGDVLSGTIIWMRENNFQVKNRKESSGGFLGTSIGKTTVHWKEYYSSFALAFCEGEIDAITDVWINDVLVYSTTTDPTTAYLTKKNKLGLSAKEKHKEAKKFLNDVLGGSLSAFQAFVVYRGTLDQAADPIIDADFGGKASAYRGVAYIVWYDLPITNDLCNNQLPEIRVKLKRTKVGLTFDPNEKEIFISNTLVQDSGSVLTKPSIWLPLENSLIKHIYSADGTTSNPIGIYNAPFSVHSVGNDTLDVSYCIGTPNSAYYKVVEYAYYGASTLRATIENVAWPIYRMRFDTSTLGVDTTVSYVTTPLLYDEQIWLYPWDFPFKEDTNLFQPPFWTLVGSTEPKIFIRPVVNTDDLYLIIYSKGGLNTNTGVAIGKLVAGRISIHVLDGLDLDSQNHLFFVGDDGTESPAAWGTNINSVAGGALAPYALNAVLIFGRVYIFCKYAGLEGIQSNRIWFPGLIIVPIEGLTWGVVPFEQQNKIVTWIDEFGDPVEYLNGELIYAINEEYTLTINAQFISNWVWNTERQYDCLAVDLESAKLYGTNIRSTPRYRNSSIVNIGTINAQSPGGVYEVDPDTGDLIQDFGSAATSFTSLGDFSANIVAYRGDASLSSNAIGYTHPAFATVVKGRYLLMPWGVYDFTNRDYVFSNWDKNIIPTDDTNNLSGDLFTGDPLESCHNVFPITLTDDYLDFIVGATISRYEAASATLIQKASLVRPYRFYFSNRRGDINSPNTLTLDEVISAEIVRTGLVTTSDIDLTELSSDVVRGVVIEGGACLETIQMFQSIYLFDLVDKDYLTQAVKRASQSVVRTIPYTDLEAGEEGETVIDLRPTVPVNYKAPSVWMLSFRDPQLEYEVNTIQMDTRWSGDNSVEKISVPVVMSLEEAIRLLDQTIKITEVMKRGVIDIQLTFQHSDLEVGDFITVGAVTGETYTLRIITIDKGIPGIVKISGQIDSPSNYVSTRTAGTQQTSIAPVPSVITLPLIIDGLPYLGEEDGVAVWVGSVNVGDINGLNISVSRDNGTTWEASISTTGKSAAGQCINTVDATRLTGVFDYTYTLSFRPLGGTFTSVSEEQCLVDEKTNTYFYGRDGRWEMLKIATFTDNMDGTYTASGLLSGYKGTAHFMGTHEIGDMLVAADTALSRLIFDLASLDTKVSLRFSPVGRNEGEEIKVGTNLAALNRLPLPVLNVEATRDSLGSITFTWVGQARYSQEWVEGSDAAICELTEEYRVYILDAGANDKVLRTITTTTTTATYTDTEQIADWGGVQTSVKVAIAQYSQTLGKVGVPYLGTL